MPAQPSHSTRLFRRRFLALGCATAALPIIASRTRPARAASIPVVKVLANGLTVIIQERMSAETVALQHTALAGVRDDRLIPGATVLTSRMLLQGTPTRPTELDMQRAATLAGGTLMRGTTSEQSSIACVMPATASETAFDLVSDAVIHPSLDPASLGDQQSVALRNIAQRRVEPSVLIDDLFQQTLFAGQPLGFAPLGTATSIALITVDTIQQTRQLLFGAANSVITVSGRIQADVALRLADQYFGTLATGVKNVRQPASAQPPPNPQTVKGTAGQQVQFRVGFMAPSLRASDRYAIAVLTGILTGFSGRLLRELRSKRGLSYTPFAGYSPLTDAGYWYAFAGVDPDKVDEALAITRGEIQRLSDELAPASEVTDAIDAIAGAQVIAAESNASVAGLLAAKQIFGDVSTEEFVRNVQLVTPNDVQRVAGAYLDLDHSLTVLVGPA